MVVEVLVDRVELLLFQHSGLVEVGEQRGAPVGVKLKIGWSKRNDGCAMTTE